jgi:hypothetical protein
MTKAPRKIMSFKQYLEEQRKREGVPRTYAERIARKKSVATAAGAARKPRPLV